MAQLVSHSAWVLDPWIRTDGQTDVSLTRFEALRSLQVGAWLANIWPGRHSTIMEMFSTITSPVFSELVIVLEANKVWKLSSDIALFQTLREMNEIKRFKLVFLLEILKQSQEEQSILEKTLKWATGNGLLDFLDSPPTIRVEVVVHCEWMPSVVYPR